MRTLVGLLALFTVGACAPPPAGGGDAEPSAEPVEGVQVAAKAAEHDEGCIHEQKEDGSCGAEAEPPTESTGHFGSPFALESTRPLAEVMGDLEKVGEAPVLVSGTVDKVCQKKGCWMVIKDGEASARILMKDHAFAIPFDGAGKAAKVEGTLKVRTFTEAQVKHLEKDGGGNPDAVGGQRTEVTMTASAVELAQS